MVSWAHTGITLAKTGPITKLAASSPKLAENTNAQEFLMYRGLGLLTSTQPLCSFVQSSTATIAVAKHTLTSVPKMKNASWKNILTASGVRLLNTACALLDTHLLVNPLEEFLTIRFPRSIGELEESLNTRFQWTLNGMTPIERMNDPVLTKGLGEAGENVIKYPENYALLADPKNPTTNCRDFNPHYKKLSLLFHPDKNPNNPKAAEVMTNLKLLKAFYCKKV
jgi:hypothetical protein